MSEPDTPICRECGTPIQLITDQYRSYWVHTLWVEECEDGPYSPEAAGDDTRGV